MLERRSTGPERADSRPDWAERDDRGFVMTKSENDVKQQLIQAFGCTCWGCSDPVGNPKNLVLDHIIPKSDGGADTIDNRALLCNHCNQRKGSRLTLSGLRENNGVKNHAVDLKGVMQWTREQAVTALIGDQFPLPISHREEPPSHTEASTNVAPSMPNFGDNDAWCLEQVRCLLWVRGFHEVAMALGHISRIDTVEDYDWHGQINHTNIELLIHAGSIEGYNYLVNLPDSDRIEIERVTREVTRTLDDISIGGFRFLLDIPKRQDTPADYGNDDVDDLPF